MNASDVVNTLNLTVTTKCRKHILERNLINGLTVVKPFPIRVIFKCIQEHIVERIHITLTSVVKPFHIAVIFKGIDKSYWEKPYEYTSYCEDFAHFYNHHDSIHTRQKPWECKQVANPFITKCTEAHIL